MIRRIFALFFALNLSGLPRLAAAAGQTASPLMRRQGHQTAAPTRLNLASQTLQANSPRRLATPQRNFLSVVAAVQHAPDGAVTKRPTTAIVAGPVAVLTAGPTSKSAPATPLLVQPHSGIGGTHRQKRSRKRRFQVVQTAASNTREAVTHGDTVAAHGHAGAIFTGQSLNTAAVLGVAMAADENPANRAGLQTAHAEGFPSGKRLAPSAVAAAVALTPAFASAADTAGQVIAQGPNISWWGVALVGGLIALGYFGLKFLALALYQNKDLYEIRQSDNTSWIDKRIARRILINRVSPELRDMIWHDRSFRIDFANYFQDEPAALKRAHDDPASRVAMLIERGATIEDLYEHYHPSTPRNPPAAASPESPEQRPGHAAQDSSRSDANADGNVVDGNDAVLRFVADRLGMPTQDAAGLIEQLNAAIANGTAGDLMTDAGLSGLLFSIDDGDRHTPPFEIDVDYEDLFGPLLVDYPQPQDAPEGTRAGVDLPTSIDNIAQAIEGVLNGELHIDATQPDDPVLSADGQVLIDPYEFVRIASEVMRYNGLEPMRDLFRRLRGSPAADMAIEELHELRMIAGHSTFGDYFAALATETPLEQNIWWAQEHIEWFAIGIEQVMRLINDQATDAHEYVHPGPLAGEIAQAMGELMGETEFRPAADGNQEPYLGELRRYFREAASHVAGSMYQIQIPAETIDSTIS